MIILGIETSSIVCSVGLVRDGKVLGIRTVEQANIHSEILVPLIKEISDETEVSIGEIDAVAISIGPGSFTGLRICMSSAKGICFALDKPLVPVPTFDAAAYAVIKENPSILKIHFLVDAKRDEFYYGAYQIANGCFNRLGDFEILSSNDVRIKDFHESDTIISDKVENVSKNFPTIKVLEFRRFCCGDAVAQVGAKLFEEGKKAEISNLEPLYLKDFVAHTVPKKLFQ